ncbi:MAG TPA: GAF domain-containing sensor histidine kinase [Terriglobales bacterium]|jgi:signal transduction histidine kinase|nr:GAF domain-containing sensor histidine kinase [Terriglobales bacterium]
MLPLGHKYRARIVELAGVLKPVFAAITAAWRAQMFEEFQLDGRAMAALERLNLGTGFALFCQEDFSSFFENLTYYGTRLSKLKVDTRTVARSLEIYQSLCEPHVQQLIPGELMETTAALEMFGSATFIAVSGAYFDAQRGESAALLSVLDAELNAQSVPALLDQILRITRDTFRANVGVLMLRDENNELRLQASVGLDGLVADDISIPLGRGFTGMIALTGEPAILADLDTSDGLLNPALRTRAKALWGVPLKTSGEVIGVLSIGFGKPYQWLPTELEMLRAIADRSALAIERARITEALREREARIAELSAHLLRVQEEERKRISRELHDETGQALMVIRLYLGMLESSAGARARGKIRETLGVVDRTIEGIRRIIGRLSPLVLQELGLIAAIRKEAKDLAKTTGVKARVAVSDDVGRLAPEVEAALYRVVQEALHNVAKHAQAKAANIQMTRENALIRLYIEDDGQGMSKPSGFTGRSFGLAGMRERISMLGGSVKVTSTKGVGTRIEVTLPAPQRQPEGPSELQTRNTRALTAVAGDSRQESA